MKKLKSDLRSWLQYLIRERWSQWRLEKLKTWKGAVLHACPLQTGILGKPCIQPQDTSASLFRLTDFGSREEEQSGRWWQHLPQLLPWSFRILAFFFFLVEEFLDDMKRSISLFWSKYASMRLVPWYKFLCLVLCSGSKNLSAMKNPSSTYSSLPPGLVGWLIQWLPKFADNEIEI